MPGFRKKPIVIEAERTEERIEIETLEGTMVGEPGDMIITGVNGERYPCKPDIFLKTYEPADADAQQVYAMLEVATDPHFDETVEAVKNQVYDSER